MFKFTVIFVALSVVSADVGLGYQYRVPQTSYGVPSYQLGGSSGHYSPAFASSSASGVSTGPYRVQAAPGGHLGSNYAQSTEYHTISGVLPVGNSGFSHGSGSYGSGSNSGFNYGSSSILGSGSSSSSNSGFNYGSSNGLSSGSNSGSSSGLNYGSGSTVSGGLSSSANTGFSHGAGSTVSYPTYQVSSTPAPGFLNQFQTSNQYQTQQNYQQFYEVKEQPAQVFKHFYVHSVPEEPEIARPRLPIVLPPPQKHYKIIFVKTPGQIRTSQIVQVPQPQNEEKTIVYVLVKKPEDRQEVIVPKVEQKAPSKPEVYYIKYNNKDSQAVINNIVSDYSKGQQLTTAGSEGFYDGSTVINRPTSSGIYGESVGSSHVYAPSGGSTIITHPSSTSFVTSASPIHTGFVSSPVSSSGYLNNPSTYGSSGFLTGLPVSGSNVHHSTVSNFGVLSDNAAENQGSSGSFETQTVSTVDNDEDSNGSVSSTVVPVVTSSTADYNQLNIISTSQGIPHESYGTPKFREE